MQRGYPQMPPIDSKLPVVVITIFSPILMIDGHESLALLLLAFGPCPPMKGLLAHSRSICSLLDKSIAISTVRVTRPRALGRGCDRGRC